MYSTYMCFFALSQCSTAHSIHLWLLYCEATSHTKGKREKKSDFLQWRRFSITIMMSHQQAYIKLQKELYLQCACQTIPHLSIFSEKLLCKTFFLCQLKPFSSFYLYKDDRSLWLSHHFFVFTFFGIYEYNAHCCLRCRIYAIIITSTWSRKKNLSVRSALPSSLQCQQDAFNIFLSSSYTIVSRHAFQIMYIHITL